MRLVQVYIEGNKIELFEDEQINVTSSVQNIADISKVFTDFSQGFTVPASTVNNAIFEHFYQSDIDGTIDHNIRRNAVIEIDLTTFRRGKIQIEKANVKNGKAENYTLTFYGDIRTLKDAFGEDMINQLDLTSLEFTYNGTEIYNRITDIATDYDVRYPLIANTRLWTYNDSGPEDITQNAHAINYSELFPAVKISKLFDAIQNDYGVTFQGTFLSDPRFTDAFLYGKNTNEHTWVSESQYIDILSYPTAASGIFDYITDTVNYEYITQVGNGTTPFEPTNAVHNVSVYIGGGVTDQYYIDVFLNGNLYSTVVGSGSNTYNLITEQNTAGLQSQIKIAVRGLQSFTFPSSIYYTLTWVDYTYGPDTITYATTNANTTVTGNVNLNNTLPDIKVTDFFAGVLKMFNMTCVGISENVYEVLPLDEWYSQGAIVDITQYTDIDSIDIERIKLYKKIAFKYQQSESFVNKNYFKLANSEYGDMSYQFAYDGEEYNVEVPFENLLFTRALDTGTDYAILGYCLDTSYNPYTPKPVILYLYGMEHTLTHNIKFFDGVTNLNISSYVLFGQDLTYQNEKYSLNFGADNSIIHLETIQQGLYAQYYFPYLLNLYSKKNRLTYVKTNLPISLLTNLKLNDRLIIRDKRYIINEMKSNLTTGEVNFSLYLDFRQLEAGQVLTPSKDEQCLEIPIRFINGALQADITTDFAGVTITPSTIYNAQTIEVCIPANPNSPAYLLAENSDNLTSEEWQNIITEESSVQVIVLTITYTFGDGSTTTQTITIIQQ